MKKILAVILCGLMLVACMPVLSFAGAAGKVYYIDSVSGDDSNTGLSEDRAFKSAEKIPFLSLEPGDKVLFKKGQIFICDNITLDTLEGTADSPIVFSSYGEGEKPLLTTAAKDEVLELHDCSYVTISDFEITAPQGGGIWVDTYNRESRGVTLSNLTMHDISNTKAHSRDTLSSGAARARACVMIKGLPTRSRYPVNDLTISDCEMYDCGNGCSVWGCFSAKPWVIPSAEEDIDAVFNKGVRITGCYFHDMDAEAVIIGICNGAVVENCRCIDCCLNTGENEDGSTFYNAAMWFWGSINSTFRYCEIAGQKCITDGMTCDFDSFTHYCTYEFIYSHDNIRFVNNCPVYSGHHGNTIRYCLSVNDNVQKSNLSQYEGRAENELKFYNNTIVNPGEICIDGVDNGYICDNIFYGYFTTSMRWKRTKTDNSGESYLDAFSGVMKNNCFWGTCVPGCAENNYICDPGFCGDDFSDPDSFRLRKGSPLIGKGISVLNMKAEDIYGNDISQNTNIGCYAGTGEDGFSLKNIFTGIFRLLSTGLGFIYQAIVDFNNTTLFFE